MDWDARSMSYTRVFAIVRIGATAQSTWGQDIFYAKITKCPNFTWCLPVKNTSPECGGGQLPPTLYTSPLLLRLWLSTRQWLLEASTCRTLLLSPVLIDSCLRSLASGLWLRAKYDFMMRSSWCLNDVRSRFCLAGRRSISCRSPLPEHWDDDVDHLLPESLPYPHQDDSLPEVLTYRQRITTMT